VRRPAVLQLGRFGPTCHTRVVTSISTGGFGGAGAKCRPGLAELARVRENCTVSEAGDFIDAALQYEVSPYAYPAGEQDGLERYGTSIGAIRGTIRDAQKRYPELSHDELTALSSELWAAAVFERRQAAIILLQSRNDQLVANDLTRLEGFIRSAGSAALVDQLVADVLDPMLARMDTTTLARVRVVIRRWAEDPDGTLRSVGRHLRESR
jgi:DNA alkylation repair enzyme